MLIISHWHNLSNNTNFFKIFIIINIVHLNDRITKLNPIFFTNMEIG